MSAQTGVHCMLLHSQSQSDTLLYNRQYLRIIMYIKCYRMRWHFPYLYHPTSLHLSKLTQSFLISNTNFFSFLII